MAAGYWQQLSILIWRNFVLKIRKKRETIQEIITPIFFILILAIIRLTVVPENKPATGFFPSHNLMQNDFKINGSKEILVVSNETSSTLVMDLVVDIVTQNGTKGTYRNFPDMAAMEEYYKANYETVSAAVIFWSLVQHNASVTIRMPFGTVPNAFYMLPTTVDKCRETEDGLAKSNCPANEFLYSGFAILQVAIGTAISKVLKLPDFELPEIYVEMLPKGVYQPTAQFIQILSAIYYVVAFSPLINVLTVSLVAEKEKKTRETMKIMGMRDSVFWLAWAAVYGLFVLIICLVATALTAACQFFQNSNFFLFFVMLFLYGLNIISLSFVITPFFSKARVAGAVASFSTMLVSTLYLVVPLTRDPSNPLGGSSIPAYGQWLLCLLAPIAFSLALDKAIFLDILGYGMTFETVTWGDFPLWAPMVMLLVDAILYALLAAYLDNVIPQEYGQLKPPYFFLLPSYWFPSSRKRVPLGEEDINKDNEDVEPMPPEMKQHNVIRIRNLTKWFRPKQGLVYAVKDFSLDIYEGQITCLLGHNGAGKTTLINLLTGMVSPASGGATVYGRDITNTNDMGDLRQSFGMCPQQNVLFDALTSEENLRVFANLKGVPREEVDTEIDRVLGHVDMQDKKNAFAETLSGGQKRKLSVALALIGDPKVLFLDEPTSGLDPYSRRHLWSLLKSKRPGKVILLTTHFMDEADILADRKAVMTKGRLKCCGSSLFLKNRFGVGYHLNMVVKENCNQSKLTEIIQSKIPGAGKGRSHGQELAYTLPLDETTRFPDLFDTLGSPEGGGNAQTLGIESYGVSMTTLEEVFLKLEEQGEKEDKPQKSLSVNSFSNRNYSNDDDHIVNNGSLAENVAIDLEHSASYRRTGETIDSILGRTKIITEERPLLVHRLKALVKIRFLLAFRNIIAVYLRMFTPVIYIAMTIVFMKVLGDALRKPLNSEDVSIRMLLESALPFINNTGHGISSFLSALSSGDLYRTTEIFSPSVLKNMSQTWALGVDALNNNGSGQVTSSNFTLYYNDTDQYSLPLALRGIFDAMYEHLYFNSYPLPPLRTAGGTDYNAFASVIFLGIALSIIPTGYAVELVRDRQCKAKSQLRIFGVSQGLYWGSIFLTDYIQYFVPSALAVIAIGAAQIEAMNFAGAIFAMVLLFLLYMPLGMLVAYCFSFAFDNSVTCLMVAPNIMLLSGFLPYLPVALLDNDDTANVSAIIHYLCCIFDPPYIIFGGLYFITRVYRTASKDRLQGPVDIPFDSYFQWTSHIPITFLMSAIYIPLLVLFLRYLDVKSTGGDARDLLKCGEQTLRRGHVRPGDNNDVINDEDTDVAEEREQVQSMDPTKAVVVVNGLRKEFQKASSGGLCQREKKSETSMLAVRNNTFAVMPGEVFGLLGPNGAGKTTTLNMIIAEVAPNRGKVMVGGYEVRSSLSKAFQMMGYCPQHDPLWETITVNEHINCFAAIKGVDLTNIEDIQNYFLSSLEIEVHKDKKAKELSGGTKRKLSYILSMLGDLKIVLLDEPSTGMDPKAKRFLWDTISASFRSDRRGAILTTHYMEEADALCSRIAIMVNGEMKCLGSATHLKNKYGSGYTLEIKLKLTNEDLSTHQARLERKVKEMFPASALNEKFGERAIFKVPKESGLSLAKAFSTLEEIKNSLDVEEYSFSQATLEQVFLDFAKKQLEEGQDSDVLDTSDRTTLMMNSSESTRL